MSLVLTETNWDLLKNRILNTINLPMQRLTSVFSYAYDIILSKGIKVEFYFQCPVYITVHKQWKAYISSFFNNFKAEIRAHLEN